MGSKWLTLLLLLSALCVQAESGQRQRRADDADPLVAIVQQQGQTIQSLQAQLTALQATVDANTQQQSKAVAFTARFSGDTVQIAPNGIFRFDAIPINIGNAYSSHSGIFTAPYAGLYLFLVNFMITNDDNFMQVAIDKSGTTLAETHADSSGSDVWDKGMTHVTVHLDVGDEVWVRHNAGGTSLYGGWWTSFTGCLLHAD